MCMTDLELRNANRYRVAAPVDFWWPSPRGSARARRGVTRDISSRGVLVITDECPPVGAAIQMTVSLPRRKGRSHPLELHGEGVVIRVQSEKSNSLGERGFAASVHFYPELPESSEHLD
jgi:hypothetical protein